MTETMKDSGQEWIGAIPESWDTNRIRYCLNEINVKNSPVKTEQILSLVKDKGVMLYEEKGDVGNKAKEDITGYKVAFPNTLIVNSMNILIGSVGISRYKGCVSPVYYVFREKDNSDLRFVNYIFNTREFQKELRKYANGILEIRLRVSATDIFNRKMPLPSKDEQIKIADFLDEKCAEIDKLSEDIQKQIDVLEEYKKSVITRAVTKGLDPNAEMKESGIQWIGKMNSTFARKKIKNACSMIGSGTTPQSSNTEFYNDGSINWIQSGDIYGKEEVTDVAVKVSPMALHASPSLKVYKAPFIVIAMYGGSVGNTAVSRINACTNQAVCCLKPNADTNLKYLYYWIQFCKEDFLVKAEGGGQPNISQDKIRNQWILLPDIAEQEKIVTYLDKICDEINDSIATKRQQIENLDTYRKSIIYEYVTGKKRVA